MKKLLLLILLLLFSISIREYEIDELDKIHSEISMQVEKITEILGGIKNVP